MITALVGKPGSGKSYYAVKRVLDSVERYKHVSMLMDGVDIAGVRVLTIDDVAPMDAGGMMRAAGNPRDWVTLGEGPALLVLDEVQRVWGTQGGKGQTLTQIHREFFQQHRHYGVDIIIIAQSVAQVTTQLAVLVDRTIEVRPVAKKLFGGTKLGRTLSLRYREGADDEGKIVAREMHRVDARVFAHYRSYDDAAMTGDAPALTSGYAGGLGRKMVLFAFLSAVGFAAAVAAVVAMTGVGVERDADPEGVQDAVQETPAFRQLPVQERAPGTGSGIICNERGCSRLP